MPTIAIVGAGDSLGLSIAKVFGRRGFDVALISRSKENLDEIGAKLGREGIAWGAFPGDVSNPVSLTLALELAAQRFAGIEVLEFSPSARKTGITTADPLGVTVENLQPHINYYLYGGIAAAQTVLPAMLEAGAGTLLFTQGGAALTPVPMYANINPAQAALRNWVLNLHKAVTDKGIYACHVAIDTPIFPAIPDATIYADDIAPLYWDLYNDRDQAEYVFTGRPTEVNRQPPTL
jgi:NAD(P)-dependent dehydrogenase (short-subunit alcohol dehydrogenase family)